MKSILLILTVFCFFKVNAQDISYNRKIVDTLASPAFWGRGYTKDGMKKAALFLAKEFKLIGLQPLDKKEFLQSFSFSANTFPGEMKVEINNKKLRPGIDFIVSEESKGLKAKGNFQQADSVTFSNAPSHLNIIFEKKGVE